MKREDIEALRATVSCAVVLERAGWRVDTKESSRRAVKYRRAGEIAIVTHEGRGWFDPLSDSKGDIFALIKHLDGADFLTAVRAAAALAGLQPAAPIWSHPARARYDGDITSRWLIRPTMNEGSAAFHYLTVIRALPMRIIAPAIDDDLVREGPYGSAWFAHRDRSLRLAGWEERGEHWSGFASGGTKLLFQFGSAGSARVCVTEAAIDALSPAALEGPRPDTLYVSTAGGWSPLTKTAVCALAMDDRLLVAATDHDSQGEAFAGEIREIATTCGCGFRRLRPRLGDWNDDLRAKRAE
jgi:hypothetical protein